MVGFSDINKTVNEVSKISTDMPKFGENIKPEYIKDSNEANKKLSINENKNNIETRQLNENEKNNIQEKTGWNNEQMKKCTIGENGIVYLKCDNEHLEGKKHPNCGVEYVRKRIEINGIKIEVVVPEFPSEFDVNLPENLLKASNKEQFKECKAQLMHEIERNPKLRSKFTKEQIEDIMDKDTLVPEGYVWHHDAEVGKMQLVKVELHDRTQGGAAHTGGKSLWGGGY